ncbi:pilus assembly protein TadG-related protein [Brevibacterium litoralis]|uniref:pilus assembly protein TadG-related protein n=1 Tax=Brevibacterium litoralis TaxID=3138935 RepID=UPI0032EF571F
MKEPIRRRRGVGTGTTDRGSVLPLGIGFSAIALALVVLAAVITDHYLAATRVQAAADSAALAAAESFVPEYGADPAILFTDAQVDAAATAFMAESGLLAAYSDVQIVGTSPDGSSIEVTVRAGHSPVLVSTFATGLITHEATGTARGALREG